MLVLDTLLKTLLGMAVLASLLVIALFAFKALMIGGIVVFAVIAAWAIGEMAMGDFMRKK